MENVERAQMTEKEMTEEPGKVTKAKILVVDNELIVRQLLSEELTEERYKVETAESNGEAFYRLKRDEYDVILLDIKLQGMTGIDLYRLLQKTSQQLLLTQVWILSGASPLLGEDTLVAVQV